MHFFDAAVEVESGREFVGGHCGHEAERGSLFHLTVAGDFYVDSIKNL